MEWISVEDRLPEDKFKKYLVKKENGELIPSFFMPDKMIWISWYGRKTSYWMDIDSGKLVHDVTHWMLLPKPQNEEECLTSSC